MINRLILILLIFSAASAYAQDGTEKVSLTFENSTRVEVLEQLETLTPYRFFFVESWFDNLKISGQYQDTALRLILNDLFTNTVVNYYFSDNYKIILTQNNLIYDDLPDDFFGRTDQEDQEDSSKPIFYSEQAAAARTGVETIRIGKESKNASRKSFVLSGQIKNNVTGEPIPNLVISVPDKNIHLKGPNG